MVKRALAVLVAGLLIATGSVAALRLTDDDRRSAALTDIERTDSRLATQETSSTLRSGDGDYQVAVTDEGIFWSGPSGEINLTPGGVTLKSSAALNVHGSGTVVVQGAVVRLCGSGGKPVARVWDHTEALIIPAPPGPGVPKPGPITEGSPTVLAC